MVEDFSDVLVITSDTLGQGDDTLGRKLMGNFFITLSGVNQRPKSIFLLNSAVKLVIESSPVLDEFNELASNGNKIYSCLTCVEYFNLKDQIKCGEIGNMRALVDAMESADKLTVL